MIMHHIAKCQPMPKQRLTCNISHVVKMSGNGILNLGLVSLCHFEVKEDKAAQLFDSGVDGKRSWD